MSAKKIMFIPVRHGDQIDVGDLGIFGISGTSKYLGFKPGRAGKREGWLVVAVNEKSSERPHKLRVVGDSKKKVA
jgi:hypothetical protein